MSFVVSHTSVIHLCFCFNLLSAFVLWMDSEKKFRVDKW